MIAIQPKHLSKLANALPHLNRVVSKDTFNQLDILKYAWLRVAREPLRLVITTTNITHAIQYYVPVFIPAGAAVLEAHAGAVIPFAAVQRVLRGWKTTVWTRPGSNADIPLTEEKLLPFTNLRQHLDFHRCWKCHGEGTIKRKKSKTVCSACSGEGKIGVMGHYLNGHQLIGTPCSRRCKHNRVDSPGLRNLSEPLHVDFSEISPDGDTVTPGQGLRLIAGDFQARLLCNPRYAVDDYPAVPRFNQEPGSHLFQSQSLKTSRLLAPTKQLAARMFRQRFPQHVDFKKDGEATAVRITDSQRELHLIATKTLS